MTRSSLLCRCGEYESRWLPRNTCFIELVFNAYFNDHSSSMREVTFLPAAVCFSTYFMNRPRSVAPSGHFFYPPAGKRHSIVSTVAQIINRGNCIVTVILHRLAGNEAWSSLPSLLISNRMLTHPSPSLTAMLKQVLHGRAFIVSTERILKRHIS